MARHHLSLETIAPDLRVESGVAKIEGRLVLYVVGLVFTCW